MSNNCLFCRIVEGKIPADKLYEDEEVIAFRDINPQAPLHALIIPRKHIASLNDLTPPDITIAGKLFLVAKQLASEAGFADSGYRVAMNNGPDSGQEVFHAHLHVLAGRAFGKMG